jgi:3-oxoacyl-[acyl-carrier protein] reductase
MCIRDRVNLEQFNDVLQTNVVGAALAAREAAKIFKKQNSGAIINIASTAATKGFAGGTPYVATKFALRGMTECWRAELRPYNVRVILINPSEVQTDFVISSGRSAREFNPSKLISEDIAHTVVAALEMHERGFITELTVFATNPK